MTEQELTALAKELARNGFWKSDAAALARGYLTLLAEHDALKVQLDEQRTRAGKGWNGLYAIEVERDQLKYAAEMLWFVLANVSGGDWALQSEEWQEAAARWRDNYFSAISIGQKA